ncbi:Endonuclease/exonuclease/phosphatase, partial [Dichomitus squalens]
MELGPQTSENRRSRRKAEQLARKASIRVASLNMNGFGTLQPDHDNNKWGRMSRLLSDNRIGVLLLQETHLTAERLGSIQQLYKRNLEIFSSPHPTQPSQREGVAVILNKRLVSSEGASSLTIVQGRALQVTLKCKGEDRIHILCVYTPTSEGVEERKRFFDQVKEYYSVHHNVPKPDLMAGDFNNVEDAIDRLPICDPPDASVCHLDQLKNALGLMLVDGWRETHPTARGYTFHRGTGDGAVLSRLDRIYVRDPLYRLARDWRIDESGIKSDHLMVSVQLTTLNAPAAGRGRPVFPLSIIRDKALTKAMKERGLSAVQTLSALENRVLTRTEEVNPQWVLAKLKSDWIKMARDREKEVIPKLLAEI